MAKIFIIFVILCIFLNISECNRELYEEIKSKAPFKVMTYEEHKKIFGERTYEDFSQWKGENKLFSPEAFSVAAISYNEHCNCPESVETIRLFRKAYGRTFRYLSDLKAGKNGDIKNIYKLIPGFLKGKSGIPDKVGTEWIRSPIFIANQDEINLLYDEKQALKSVWGKVLDKAKSKDPRAKRWRQTSQIGRAHV